MRICMICMDFPPMARGAGYHVYNLSKRLAQREHQVTVFTRGSWGQTHFEKIDGIPVYRVRFIPAFPFHLQVHGFFINRLLKSVERNFDIIHLHNPLVPIVHTSLPIVITCHGTSKEGIAQRKTLDLFSLGLKLFSAMYVSHERKLVTKADKVIAVSQACAEELRLYYRLGAVEVVPNALDTKLFIPAKSRNKVAPYVLYAGALDSRKGLPDLVMAAKYVCQQNKGVKFTLAGTGHLEKHLKKLVHTLNLDGRFSFIGHVSQNTLLKYYQNATIFVLPSYYEGLPTTILEAMSCGIPTVATAVAGTSELLADGEDGILVPPKNPQKLAEAILELLGDSQLRQRMGENARRRAKEDYDWDIIAERIEKIYAEILSIS